MTKKIFRSIFGACLFVLSIALLAVVFTIYRGFVNEDIARLEKETRIVAGALNHSDDIQSDLEIFALSDIRLVLIAPDGEITYDSINPANHENHYDRQEIVDARNEGSGFSIRYSQTLSTETYNCAMRLNDGSFVRLSQSHSSLLALYASSLRPMLIIVPILAGAAWIVAHLLARHIVIPINAIDLSHPLDSVPYEQLQPLLERLDSNNRQIEGQMRQLEEKSLEIEALSTSMSEGLIMADAQGSPAFVNDAARRIFKLKENQTPSDHPMLKELMDKAMRNEKSQVIYRHGGRIYSLQADPIRKGKKTIGGMVLALDITEKQQARERRQQFTANVTHELKTPLQTISSSAELLVSGLVKPEDIGQFAGYIVDESRRLSELVNDVLHLSRLEQEQTTPLTDIDLCALAREQTEKLIPSAKMNEIDLRFEGEEAEVVADRRDLEDILRNLIENAIRYNRPQGSVVVSVHQTDQHVVLSVKDTGVGIPKDSIDRIFERFYTVDPSRTKGGTGLGLAIVRHAAENLNAKVFVKSKEGKGSTFTVRFIRPASSLSKRKDDGAQNKDDSPKEKNKTSSSFASPSSSSDFRS